jgi:hypothetical protein
MEYKWNDTDGKTQRKTCPIATCPLQIPQTGLGLNLCLQDEKARTVLTHGMALEFC